MEWEREAKKALKENVPTSILRFGVVMGKDGGALKQLVPLFRSYLGGPVGSGTQWVSWIHMEDVINVIVRIDREMILTKLEIFLPWGVYLVLHKFRSCWVF